MLTRGQALAIAALAYDVSADLRDVGGQAVNAGRLLRLGQAIETNESTVGGICLADYLHREAEPMAKPKHRREGRTLRQLGAALVPRWLAGQVIARRLRRAGAELAR